MLLSGAGAAALKPPGTLFDGRYMLPYLDKADRDNVSTAGSFLRKSFFVNA
jgi:hypothetical protein